MQGVINDAYTTRANDILDRRAYRLGVQRRQIKPGRYDDNLIMNFTGLSIERGVSMLFGEPPEFEFEKGEGDNEQEVKASPQEDYIDEMWEANSKAILLHDLAEDGGESGDCWVKIVPNGLMHNDKPYPELVVLDPSFMDVRCAPNNLNKITTFIIQFKTTDDSGKETGRREITQWTPTSDTEMNTGYWLITSEINVRGKWEEDPTQPPINWEWDFPPIVHWKNLPFSHSVFGMPDVTPDVVELQDRLNFVSSNMSKIIRLYAHPQRWSKFFGKDPGAVTMGPEDMPNSNNEKAEINQLVPVADLESSRLFLLNLRQSLFDITRTVDITSIADKLGTLTNFGLHVLYQDAVSKLNTKRELYGWGLKEINRRVMILANMEPLDCDVVWKNPLPENIVEAMQVDQGQLGMGIVSKQTVSERAGYDYEKEQARIAEEGKASGPDLGTALLNAFNKGQGAPAPMTPPANMPMNENNPNA
jgi:hypothetical protein